MISDSPICWMYVAHSCSGYVLPLEQGVFPDRVLSLLAWRWHFLHLGSRNRHVLCDTRKMSPSPWSYCVTHGIAQLDRTCVSEGRGNHSMLPHQMPEPLIQLLVPKFYPLYGPWNEFLP